MLNQDKQRLHKFLSSAGVTSRRKAEVLIASGRVKVNGKVVTDMGVMVTPGKSRIEVDNKPVFWHPERVYVLLHKPPGYITSLSDPEQRPLVVDLLPKGMPRVVPVGRLDWDTEGLLVLTNDGDLSHRLMHPSHKLPRVYHAKLKGEVRDDSPALLQLKEGVTLDDGFVQPDRVAILGYTSRHTWIEFEIHVGKNRIVRRLCEAVGHTVLKLRRAAFGPLTLEGLPQGAFRDLTPGEVKTLYQLVGGDVANAPPVRSKPGTRILHASEAGREHIRPPGRPRLPQAGPGGDEAPRPRTRAAAPGPRVRQPRPGVFVADGPGAKPGHKPPGFAPGRGRPGESSDGTAPVSRTRRGERDQARRDQDAAPATPPRERRHGAPHTDAIAGERPRPGRHAHRDDATGERPRPGRHARRDDGAGERPRRQGDDTKARRHSDPTPGYERWARPNDAPPVARTSRSGARDPRPSPEGQRPRAGKGSHGTAPRPPARQRPQPSPNNRPRGPRKPR